MQYDKINSQLVCDRQQILVLLSDGLLLDTLLHGHRPSKNTSLYQDIQTIHQMVNHLHAADLADLLEMLPQNKRQAVWLQTDNAQRGKTLVECSDAVWDSLTHDMSDSDLLAALKPLALDQQVYLAENLPHNLIEKLLSTLTPSQRETVFSIRHLDRDQIGSLMDFELVAIRQDITLDAVLRFLRQQKRIAPSTDKLFVIDRQHALLGELPLTALLLHPTQTRVADLMVESITFSPEDKAEDVAGAFERYDLISAAVVNPDGKLVGRLTVDDMVDVVYEERDSDLRHMGGLSDKEEIFSPVMKSVRQRSTWLAVNLCTAFVASRVIGLFEHSISELVALAALMPIVAGIGGNTGNQTITMIVRALALHHIRTGNTSFLMLRELGVALINGLFWGGIMGGVTYLLYDNAALGGVMMLAMLLNLLVAAFMGVSIPMLMNRLGKDPAIGSSVMITAITDTGGFFIFLGLATIFLL